jgi:hypothetical protein
MASLLIKIVDEFEITNKLRFFILDNANSNDTCLQAFFPNATPHNLKERRLRCWGHILNLIVKAFLFRKNADAFEIDQNANIELRRVKDELEA